MSLVTAVQAYVEGRSTPDIVARAFYNDRKVMRVVRGACRTNHFEELTDDVHQETGMRFVTQILGRVQDPQASYAVVKQTAVNICGDLLRKRVARPERSLDELIEQSGENGDGTADSLHLPGLRDERLSDLATNVAAQIDHQQACAVFMTRQSQHPAHSAIAKYEWLHFFGESSRATSPSDALMREVEKDRTPPVREGKRAKKNPSWFDTTEKTGPTLAQELIDIRDAHGLSNEKFAELLNITETMLCFYLYTAPDSAPPAVMAEARALKESMGDAKLKEMNALFSLEMRQIIENWMRLLDINPEDVAANVKLSAALGISRTTVWRWRSNNMRPRRAELVENHQKVMKLKNR